MEYRVRVVSGEDRVGVIDVFNHYVEHSFAAYPEARVPYGFFDALMGMAGGYPFYVVEASDSKKIIGYGLLRPHSPMPAFRRAAELTCFIAPGWTGKGIGTGILNRLIGDARGMGIDIILASVSSLNDESISFHRKHGFVECGRFKRVGKKRGKDFDEVWMQLLI